MADRGDTRRCEGEGGHVGASRTCGGTAKVIACIEDPVISKKILTYLEEKKDDASRVPVAGQSSAAAVQPVRLIYKRLKPVLLPRECR
jgi:hypothetical protein